MNQSQAEQTVLAVMIVTAAVILWGNIKSSGAKTAAPTGKGLVSFVILGAVLALGAGAAPQLFGPFAILVGLAVVISRIRPSSVTKRIGGTS